MLHIYYGRDNINKDRFLYDRIKGSAVVLVPDQFTVQAERDAFFYTGRESLMDLEILSFSRLCDRVLEETGGGRRPMIDRQGRNMLLTRILRGLAEELQVYGHYAGNPAFIDNMNDFLSEIKQYGRTPEDLEQIAAEIPPERYLHRKLTDAARVFRAYEEAIAGKYLDTEDRLSLVIDHLPRSRFAAAHSFWIRGFDVFSPKNRELLRQLMRCAPDVHVLISWDEEGADAELFALTGRTITTLEQDAAAVGTAVERSPIGSEYRETRPPALRDLEAGLFALPQPHSEATEGLKLVRAANYYDEAEAAAVEVLRLVREEGLHYRDIGLICNDLETRGRICRRVFAQYGLPVFLDARRDILDHPAVRYILALTDILAGSFQADDILRLIKTGLTDLDDEEADRLENYVRGYSIRGPLFREEFTRGRSELPPEELEALNRSRRLVVDGVLRFTTRYREEKTVRGKVESLYRYLAEDCRLPERIDAQIREDEEAGRLERAAESAQVWNVIVSVFDQMVEITGDSGISQKDFAAMFRAGFAAVEIGVIPPAQDMLMLGTMKRTRLAPVRALLVLGANEGVLPSEAAESGLLSENEKLELAALGEEERQLCRPDRDRVQEENLAVYRNFVRPTEELWLSCSLSDEEGQALRPSTIYETAAGICTRVTVHSDPVTAGEPLGLLTAPEIGMEHLTAALRAAVGGAPLEAPWLQAFSWYRQNRPEMAARLERGLSYRGGVDNPTPARARQLYGSGETLTLSPTRLERFGQCPFSHFVHYGLRPEEPRIYRVEAPDTGTICHRCLRAVSQRLTAAETEITDPASPWMTIDHAACDRMTEDVLTGETAHYREGLFASSAAESYRARRLRQICCDAVWAMVSQVRSGSIKAMEEEIRFGRDGRIPPIRFTIDGGEGERAAADSGRTGGEAGQAEAGGDGAAGRQSESDGGEAQGDRLEICLEGTIDRVDYLPGDRVKVIDYKSGRDTYRREEALAGWKLQLFVYLRAACEEKYEPAGAFYFHFSGGSVDATGYDTDHLAERVGQELRKSFCMDGFVVDDPDVIESIDGGLEGSSTVIPVRRNKDGKMHQSAERLLEPEEMARLLADVNAGMDRLCRRLAGGDIAVRPRRTQARSACTYCGYRGICKFDVTFDGCEYELIRRPPRSRSGSK
ncbi:MAG: PD-(D/E)XK nuclease family protein [Anaerovoracaceae bacterium]|jgi:ATP-dependent helicase/nuclease subunit B